ncbi:MAG: restriction endonuclease, partial [Nitrospirae bacterium]|nr:restriction endonuclease [Nitrospirota bacterium]
MASDFLTPMPDEGTNKTELLDIILNENESIKVNPLTNEDIRLLTGDSFEALIALIEEKSGLKTTLTPYSGDMGIDVVSTDKKHIRLIQCKHTSWDAKIDDDVIDEMNNALDTYSGRLLKEINDKVLFELVLVTNGKLSSRAISNAKNSDIKIIIGYNLLKLLEKIPCTLAEIYEIESRRMKSMPDVKAKV